MKFLMPAEYGFKKTDAEMYVAIAVMDFMDQSEPADIHLSGIISKEYAGMLCLYAIARGLSMLEDDPTNYKLMKSASDEFNPLNISDKLVGYINEAING